MRKRVVITGLGVISSLGQGIDKFWNNIKEGKSGIRTVDKFDISEMTCKVAAQMVDFEATDYIEKKETKRMDLYTQYAMAAAKLAIENSKLDLDNIDNDRFGTIIASGIGGIETLENQHSVLLEKGPKRISPFFIPMMIANMATGLIAIKFKAKGYNEAIDTACASANHALGNAFKVIQDGRADIMISGGAEAPLTPISFAGFCSMKAVSSNPDPATASRPFDAERDGFVMGEGAGVLILEELEHAKKRNANIIAEIIGYGNTNDAFHMTQPAPEGEGGARCMKLCLDDANIEPAMVDYINAHGTSTHYNDKIETAAIKTVFGEYAKKLSISSTKSMTGHLLGAAGAVEAIITSMSIKNGFIPPTINYKTKDPECDLDYVVNEGKSYNIEYAISNSLGFGGHNVTVAFKKYE